MEDRNRFEVKKLLKEEESLLRRGHCSGGVWAIEG